MSVSRPPSYEEMVAMGGLPPSMTAPDGSAGNPADQSGIAQRVLDRVLHRDSQPQEGEKPQEAPEQLDKQSSTEEVRHSREGQKGVLSWQMSELRGEVQTSDESVQLLATTEQTFTETIRSNYKRFKSIIKENPGIAVDPEISRFLHDIEYFVTNRGGKVGEEVSDDVISAFLKTPTGLGWADQIGIFEQAVKEAATGCIATAKGKKPTIDEDFPELSDLPGDVEGEGLVGWAKLRREIATKMMLGFADKPIPYIDLRSGQLRHYTAHILNEANRARAQNLADATAQRARRISDLHIQAEFRQKPPKVDYSAGGIRLTVFQAAYLKSAGLEHNHEILATKGVNRQAELRHRIQALAEARVDYHEMLGRPRHYIYDQIATVVQRPGLGGGPYTREYSEAIHSPSLQIAEYERKAGLVAGDTVMDAFRKNSDALYQQMQDRITKEEEKAKKTQEEQGLRGAVDSRIGELEPRIKSQTQPDSQAAAGESGQTGAAEGTEEERSRADGAKKPERELSEQEQVEVERLEQQRAEVNQEVETLRSYAQAGKDIADAENIIRTIDAEYPEVRALSVPSPEIELAERLLGQAQVRLQRVTADIQDYESLIQRQERIASSIATIGDKEGKGKKAYDELAAILEGIRTQLQESRFVDFNLRKNEAEDAVNALSQKKTKLESERAQALEKFSEQITSREAQERKIDAAKRLRNRIQKIYHAKAGRTDTDPFNPADIPTVAEKQQQSAELEKRINAILEAGPDELEQHMLESLKVYRDEIIGEGKNDQIEQRIKQMQTPEDHRFGPLDMTKVAEVHHNLPRAYLRAMQIFFGEDILGVDRLADFQKFSRLLSVQEWMRVQNEFRVSRGLTIIPYRNITDARLMRQDPDTVRRDLWDFMRQQWTREARLGKLGQMRNDASGSDPKMRQHYEAIRGIRYKPEADLSTIVPANLESIVGDMENEVSSYVDVFDLAREIGLRLDASRVDSSRRGRLGFDNEDDLCIMHTLAQKVHERRQQMISGTLPVQRP